MEGSNSNLLHYGFSSLDEEIAKDQMDAENELNGASAQLNTSTSEQDGGLGNVNPSAIFDISASETQTDLQQKSAPTPLPQAAQAITQTAPKPKPPSRSRKRKANKTPRDENAPRQPLSGYVLYMNDRRSVIKAASPNISFSDLTKTIAAEWSTMDATNKKVYLDMADKKKSEYIDELKIYKKSEAYKAFKNKKQEAAASNSKVAKAPETQPAGQPKEPPVRMPGMDIPIFTEEFLEHNKSREKELRELRKFNSQYEEQNAILSTHVDELKKIVNTLEEEANIQRNNNIALIQHLESLRDTLASNFAGIPLPDTNEVATVATIDSYMTKLHEIILGAPQENEDLIVAVREVVNKLNLEAYVG